MINLRKMNISSYTQITYKKGDIQKFFSKNKLAKYLRIKSPDRKENIIIDTSIFKNLECIEFIEIDYNIDIYIDSDLEIYVTSKNISNFVNIRAKNSVVLGIQMVNVTVKIEKLYENYINNLQFYSCEIHDLEIDKCTIGNFGAKKSKCNKIQIDFTKITKKTVFEDNNIENVLFNTNVVDHMFFSGNTGIKNFILLGCLSKNEFIFENLSETGTIADSLFHISESCFGTFRIKSNSFSKIRICEKNILDNIIFSLTTDELIIKKTKVQNIITLEDSDIKYFELNTGKIEDLEIKNSIISDSFLILSVVKNTRFTNNIFEKFKISKSQINNFIISNQFKENIDIDFSKIITFRIDSLVTKKIKLDYISCDYYSLTALNKNVLSSNNMSIKTFSATGEVSEINLISFKKLDGIVVKNISRKCKINIITENTSIECINIEDENHLVEINLEIGEKTKNIDSLCIIGCNFNLIQNYYLKIKNIFIMSSKIEVLNLNISTENISIRKNNIYEAKINQEGCNIFEFFKNFYNAIDEVKHSDLELNLENINTIRITGAISNFKFKVNKNNMTVKKIILSNYFEELFTTADDDFYYFILEYFGRGVLLVSPFGSWIFPLQQREFDFEE